MPASKPSIPREPLARVPVPPLLAAFLFLILVSFCVALARAPESISDAVALERGRRELANGDPLMAIRTFKSIDSKYPEILELKIDLADAYERSHQAQEASDLLSRLQGADVTKEQGERLSEIYDRVSRDLHSAKPFSDRAGKK